MFDFLKSFGASCRVSGGSTITSAGRAIEGFGIDMQSKGWLTRFSMVNLTVFLCDRKGNPIVNNAVLQATGKPVYIDGETAIKAVLAKPFEYSVKIVANDANNVTSVEAAKKFQSDFNAICGIQPPAQPQAAPQPQTQPQPEQAQQQPQTQTQPQPQAQVQPQAQPQPQAAQTPQPQQPSWEPVSVKDIDLNDYEPTC